MILLTPGPCMTSQSVRQAAAMPDMNHRDPAFIRILRETKRKLLGVYPDLATGDSWHPYLIGGSGTAAVEAMITSCVREGPVLVIDSGYYSGRIKSKLEAHGIPYEVFSTQSWLLGIEDERRTTYEVIQSLLTRATRFEALITTHHETTTGRLHDLGEVGRACQEANVKLLVDGMSSFGADHIDFANVSALASSANKCLHGLPGLSFVLVREELAKEMRTYEPRTVYLSLPFYEGDSPPLTPPVPILNALLQALVELGPNGAVGRRMTYIRRAKTIRMGLRERGFSFAIPEDKMSCTLTTASIPSGFDSETWFDANLASGFMVYGTKGDLRDRWFQVANMGEIGLEQLQMWLASVDDLLR